MDDNQIIELYFARNQLAIDETDKKYRGYVWSIIINILKDHEDSEECVNDSYLRVWNSIPPNKPNSLLAFLGKIARNTSLDKYKSRKAKKRKGNDFGVLLSELEECIPSNEDVWEKLEEEILTKHINIFLDVVSQRDRNIFIRRYFYADSVLKISIMYNLRKGNIKTILFRTRAKLSLYLQKEGYVL